MKKKEFRIEHGFYILITILAFAVRLIGLGKIPLSENEAYIANQTLGFIAKENIQLAPQLWLNLTGMMITVFGATTFWVRLIPAILGSLIPIFPYFIRDKINQKTALILSIILAFDPLSIAASRKIGSPIVAIFFFLLTITLFNNNKIKLSAIAFSALVLSGAQAFHGLMIVFLFITIIYMFSKKKDQFLFEIDRKKINNFIIVFGVSFALIASMGGYYPQGIANGLENIFTWFFNWGVTQEISIIRLIVSLPVYAPLIVLFAIYSIIKPADRQKTLIQKLALFASVALFLTMIYPNRQVFDLLWTTIPLALVASFGVVQPLSFEKNKMLGVVFSLAIGLVLFGFFFWFNLASLAKNNYLLNSNEFLLQIAIIVVVLVLMILSVMMVAAGWGKQAANQGLWLAFIILTAFYSLAIGWRGTHDLKRMQSELWNQGFSANQVAIFNQAIEEISRKATGFENSIPIDLQINSQSLQWETRNQVNNSENSIQFIVTPNNAEIENLQENYRGQSFNYQSYPLYQSQSFNSILNWIIYREIPYYQQEIILWVPESAFE